MNPIIMALPYPEIKVKEKNPAYANLLSIDYCGAVSEMSAITQYINNEAWLSCEKSPIAQTILGLAVAEMMHLRKLGELIILLGGTLDFSIRQQNGKRAFWTPAYLTIPEHAKKMISADIEAEKAAIRQYQAHIKMINDPDVNAVLARIIQDEEYHILILKSLMKEV